MFTGLPAPTLTWHQRVEDGLKPIQNDDKHKIYVLVDHGGVLSVNEYWFQLEVINVQANDYGKYVCRGKNSVGMHEAEIQLYGNPEKY